MRLFFGAPKWKVSLWFPFKTSKPQVPSQTNTPTSTSDLGASGFRVFRVGGLGCLGLVGVFQGWFLVVWGVWGWFGVGLSNFRPPPPSGANSQTPPRSNRVGTTSIPQRSRAPNPPVTSDQAAEGLAELLSRACQGAFAFVPS